MQMYEYRAAETIKLNVNSVETPKTRYLYYHPHIALQFLNLKKTVEYELNTKYIALEEINVNAT